MTVGLDPAAEARARALGPDGLAWLDALPGVVEGLAREWRLEIGPSLTGGTASWAGRVRMADGTGAVLKVALPQGHFWRRVGAMVRADGRGYVRVLRYDLPQYAVLLEELGPIPDPATAWPAALMRLGARVLREAWQVSRDPDDPGAPDADPKVAVLRPLIDTELARITDPVSDEVVDRARALLDRRGDAWDPRRTVVVHGDGHIANMLPVLRPRAGAVQGHVFVDPDAFVADPAYDLGVLVRDWSTVLAASRDPSAELRGWCRMLADETGVDEQVIWEWGYIERVTSGLHIMGLGMLDWGRPFLEVAARLR